MMERLVHEIVFTEQPISIMVPEYGIGVKVRAKILIELRRLGLKSQFATGIEWQGDQVMVIVWRSNIYGKKSGKIALSMSKELV